MFNKTGYTSITCSKISNIPYHLIFTTKCNDSSILITVISWYYLNLSFADEYVGDVTIPTQVIKYNLFFPRQISQSDCSIHMNLFAWTSQQDKHIHKLQEPLNIVQT